MKLGITGLLIVGSFLVPSVARADCVGALTSVQNSISQQSQLSVTYRFTDASGYYVGGPKNRPYQIVIELSGGDTEGFMRAGAIRRQAARWLIDECPTLGSVDFADEGGAPRAAIGLLPSGKVDFFQCVPARGGGGNHHPKWGTAYCNPDKP